MKADTTAHRVLFWALDAAGPPPAGPLAETTRLARPSEPTLAAAAELLRSGAARLGAGNPPLGDRTPVGAGPILLAAAVGGRAAPDVATRLAAVVRAPRPVVDGRWADALARHLLVAPAVSALTVAPVAPVAPAVPAEPVAHAPEEPSDPAAAREPLTESLLRASPLTGVLLRPPRSRVTSGTTAEELATAAHLLGRPHGRRLLARTVARWVADPQVLAWRAALLTSLLIDHEDAVIETYLEARSLFGPAWDEKTIDARRELLRPGIPDDLHVETIRFWAPLDRLISRRPDLLRRHCLLGTCKGALNLVRQYRLSVRAAA